MNVRWHRLDENGPGLAASVLLHGIVIVLLLWQFRHAVPERQPDLHRVLVDIVHLGPETASAPAPAKAPAASQQATVRRPDRAHSPRETVQPRALKPSDDLDNRLNALAKLKAPETNTQTLIGPGNATAPPAENDAPAGSDAAYALRDYVRAQVLRRWSLDLALVGKGRTIVALRVTMKATGEITRAEIVDTRRYAADAVFRQIAMSARNAVLLSSPIQLPAGSYPAETEMTIGLDPRDAMR
ncbi:MAG: hypothetical protein JO261_06855 [Alphaproteobacteria bacterium]|nr:hypothetical protein [Alphaproteobacteria bacterium]MBV9693402.1 hypothetical protein [Alphaproteobacteria bacterium]